MRDLALEGFGGPGSTVSVPVDVQMALMNSPVTEDQP